MSGFSNISPGSGERLDYTLRRWLEARLGADLSAIRLHTDASAAALTQMAGAAALAHGRDLLFAPGWFDPDSVRGRRLLIHEITHALQQRRPRKSERVRPRLAGRQLEYEADRVADAVLANQRVTIDAVLDCPSWQPGLPFILAVAAIAVLVGGGAAVLSSEEDVQRDAAQLDEHTYETLWGFVPVVGSLDQMLNGRTRTQRALGGAFLVLDASLIGGVIVKGIMVAVSRRAVLRATATAAERTAGEQLLNNGARFGTKAEISEALQVASAQGPLVLAASEGALNHSVSYVIMNGKIWRMHGGPMQMFFREGTREVSEAALQGIAARANTISIYPVATQTAEQTVQWWSGQLARGRLAMFTAAEGCAGSQAVLLNQIGQGVAGAGRSRFVNPFFPLFLDEARIAGTAGTHIVTNQFASNAARGSASHLTTQALVQGAGREVAWTVNWGEALDSRYEVLSTARATGANQLSVSTLTSPTTESLEGMVLEEVTVAEFNAALGRMLTTSSPEELVIQLPTAPAGQ